MTIPPLSPEGNTPDLSHLTSHGVITIGGVDYDLVFYKKSPSGITDIPPSAHKVNEHAKELIEELVHQKFSGPDAPPEGNLLLDKNEILPAFDADKFTSIDGLEGEIKSIQDIWKIIFTPPKLRDDIEAALRPHTPEGDA